MNRQNIFLIIFVLLLAGLGYFWYQNYRSAPSAEVNKEDTLRNRLTEFGRLKDLKLDTSLFQEKFFKNLEAPGSTGQPQNLTPTKPGRVNPFVPF